MTFFLREGGASVPVIISEELVRDGTRLLATQNGRHYATWFILDSGVWRLDPKGTGTYLRYLPSDLQHGLSWKQAAGSGEVWFHLTAAESECITGEKPVSSGCWRLSVLNQGERLDYTWMADRGPIRAISRNRANPATAYEKSFASAGPTQLSSRQRSELLATGSTHPDPALAVITRVTQAEFNVAAGNLGLSAPAPLPGIRVDLDGDGRDEEIRGPLNDWVAGSIEIAGQDGNRIAELRVKATTDLHRARVVRLPSIRNGLLLYEHGRPDQQHDASLVYLRSGQVSYAGWDKSVLTRVDSVEVSPDGTITAERFMADPAGHKRIRTYRVRALWDYSAIFVDTLSTRFVAAGSELIYPKESRDVLMAALAARLWDLKEELPRYFVSPAAANAFAADDRFRGVLDAFPVRVTLGKLGPVPQRGFPAVTPAPLPPDGRLDFLMIFGGYEFGAGGWGQVTFVEVAPDRFAIKELNVQGYQWIGV